MPLPRLCWQRLCLVLVFAISPGFSASQDCLILGDEVSERAHGVVLKDAPAGPGARGETARYLGVGGELRFIVRLTPGTPSLVTLQYSGDDVAGAVVAAGARPLKLGAPTLDVLIGDRELVPDLGDYEILGAEPALPGRFFYRTYLLPAELTAGRDKIEVTLRPSPTTGGAYAKVGGGAAKVVRAGVYSRGVYRVFAHADNFTPPPASAGFTPPVASAVIDAAFSAPPDYALVRRRLVEQLDAAVDAVRGRQLYGPEFDAGAKRLGVPPAVRGLFNRPSVARYLERGDVKDAKPDWLTPVTGSGNGRAHASAGWLFMRAYDDPASRHHGDRELIDRTVAMLDGYRRYQGANGAWEIGGGSDGWIGGPERKNASGGLQGFFVAGLARSFLAVWPHVQADAALLDARIDSDGDGAPDVTRRAAWTELFRAYLANQMGQRGGVANQAQANAVGASLAARALRTLDPKAKTDDADIALLVRQATGLAPHPKGVWMMTRTGLNSEAGGFCPSYGQHPHVQLPVLIESGFEPAVRARYAQNLAVFAQMVFTREGAAGGPLLVEGPVGSRQHPFPGKALDWSALAYAADAMKDDFAAWAMAVGLHGSDNLREFDLGPADGVHLLGNAEAAAVLLDRLPAVERALARPSVAAYRLPALRAEPSVFADPEAGLVAIHAGGGRSLYLQRGRYHWIEPHTQAFGELTLRETGGIRAIAIGPWYVVQNISDTHLVADEGRAGVLRRVPDRPTRDLISGRTLPGGAALTVRAGETLVLELGAAKLVDAP